MLTIVPARCHNVLAVVVLVALVAGGSFAPVAGASTAAQTSTFQNGVAGYTGHDFTTIGFDSPTPLAGMPFVQIVDRLGPAPDGRETGGHNGLLRFRGLFGCGTGQIPHHPLVVDARLTMYLFQTTLAGGTVGNSPSFDQTVNIYALRRPFDQASAIWTHAAEGVAWEEAGARGYTDRDPLPEDSVLTTLPGDYTWNVTSSLQRHLEQGRDLAWMILSPDALEDNGDNTRWSNARLTVSYISSQLQYSGALQVAVSGTLAVSATLLDPDGHPVANAPVTFTLDAQQATGMTDAAGQVNVPLPAPSSVGSYILTADAPGSLQGTPGACLRQPIEVVNNTAPKITVFDTTQEANMLGGWSLAFAPVGTAFDAEDGLPSVSCSPPIGSVLPMGTGVIACRATDSGGLTATDTGSVTIVDSIPPTIICPPLIDGTVGQTVVLGQPDVSDIADANPSVSTNAPAAFQPGTTLITWVATDQSGNTAACVQSVTLRYRFSGFYQPVDTLPALNRMNAGRVVPFKFTLLDASGASVSDLAAIARYGFGSLSDCAGAAGPIEEYADAGATSLRYDPLAGQYILNAATNTAWAGSCKTFTLELVDGTQHQANFTFVK